MAASLIPEIYFFIADVIGLLALVPDIPKNQAFLGRRVTLTIPYSYYLVKRFIVHEENTIFFTRAYCGVRYGCSVVVFDG